MDSCVNSSTENSFRLWAFHVLYRRLSEEPDPTVRFATAIVESARPVSRKMLLAWKLALAELRLLAHERDEPRQPCRMSAKEYMDRARGIISKHTGQRVALRAWEIDAITAGNGGRMDQLYEDDGDE